MTTKEALLLKQDLKKLVKAMPQYFPGFAKALTDFASVAKKVVGGNVEPAKRKRGRPRKQTVASPQTLRSEPAKPKKRGRPKKTIASESLEVPVNSERGGLMFGSSVSIM